MFDRLKGMFRKGASDGLNQTQREAYIDCLVWVMYQDQSLSLGEVSILQSEAESLDWQSTRDLEDYINHATTKARNAVADPHASERYLEDIAARLQTQRLRLRAVDASRSIARSDGDLHSREAAFIEKMRSCFGLTSP
jgi:uncharacterized tellurite resistance protein B-like protein